MGRHPCPTRAVDRHAATRRARWGQRLGALINSAAGNLAGQGANIRRPSSSCPRPCRCSTSTAPTCSEPSRTCPHDLLAQLNISLAAVSGCWLTTRTKSSSEPSRISTELSVMCRDSLRRTKSRSAPPYRSSSQSPTQSRRASTTSSRPCTLPNAVVNFNNIYEPANGSLTGTLQVNNFANPIHSCAGQYRPASRMAPTSRQTLRAVPGTDRQEPAVQLPRWGESLRRGHPGQTQRSHVQRGLDAAGLRSTNHRIHSQHPPTPSGPLPAETALPVAVTTDPAAGLPGMMTPPAGALMNRTWQRRLATIAVLTAMVATVGGCGWRGSTAAAGTQGNGPGRSRYAHRCPTSATSNPTPASGGRCDRRSRLEDRGGR